MMEPRMDSYYAGSIVGYTRNTINKIINQYTIPVDKVNNKNYINFLGAKEIFTVTHVNKVICFQIVKGGTGKTLCAVNMAAASTLMGLKTLVIDIDPQYNATSALGVDPQSLPVLIDVLKGKANIKECVINAFSGCDIIPSRVDNVTLDSELMLQRHALNNIYTDFIDEFKQQYDVIIFDCPPTLGASVTAATIASDIIAAPLTPNKYSLNGLEIIREELTTIRKRFKCNPMLKIFFNRFSSNRVLSRETLEWVMSDPNLKGCLMQSIIRAAQPLENLVDHGKSVFDEPRNKDIKEDFWELTKELLGIEEIKYAKAK